jgi:hypothetical protein
MSVALFVVSLGVIAAYVCRMDSINKDRDPVWVILLTYAMWVVAIDSAVDLAEAVSPLAVAGLASSALWLAVTYRRKPKRSGGPWWRGGK